MTRALDGTKPSRPAAKPLTAAQRKAQQRRIEAAKGKQANLDQIARMRAKGIWI